MENTNNSGSSDFETFVMVQIEVLKIQRRNLSPLHDAPDHYTVQLKIDLLEETLKMYQDSRKNVEVKQKLSLTNESLIKLLNIHIGRIFKYDTFSEHFEELQEKGLVAVLDERYVLSDEGKEMIRGLNINII